MQKEYTILIDTREKHPLQFPDWLPVANTDCSKSTSVKLWVRKSTLETGDYVLAEAPEAGAVERKASLAELHNNLRSRDLGRFTACLERLSHFRAPMLLLEGTPAGYSTASASQLCPDPPLVMSHLNRLCLSYGIPVVFATGVGGKTGRRAVGEFVARFLIDASLTAQPKETP